MRKELQAVELLEEKMVTKLIASNQKGRSGFENCSEEELSRMLREHVEKGDPIGVANFCAFLVYNGMKIV